MRVAQGGHDVPSDKLVERFPRTLENLARAIRVLPHVLVYDNGNLAKPFRLAATFERGRAPELAPDRPAWLAKALHSGLTVKSAS